MATNRALSAGLPLFTMILLLAACEDDLTPGATFDAAPQADTLQSPTNDALAGEAMASGDAGVAEVGAPETPPLYLVHTAVQDMTGRTNHFSLVSSLNEAKRLDYTQSLALPGRARLYAASGIGFFALADGEAPTITRYEIGADNSFKKGQQMSLQQLGVKNMGAQAVLFISPTKAYYKDADEGQVIVWDPSTMTITKTLPLPADVITGPAEHLLGFSQWASRPGEAYFAVGFTTKTYDRVAPHTTLVRIDTTTDSLVATKDTRCRGLNKTGQVAGALYFFSDVINGFGHAVYPNDGGQADCFLRVAPGQSTFDPTFVGSVAGAFPGKFATVVALSPQGRAWVQAVDGAVAPNTAGSTYLEWYAKGWTWSHLDLDSPTQATPIAGDPGAYAGTAFALGNDLFISQTKPDYSETTMVNLAGAAPANGLSFLGFALDVARVR